MGIGAGLTLPAVYAALMAIESSGYGTSFFARLFFPYVMLLWARTGGSGMSVPLMVLAFVQLPVEGALLGLALTSKRPSLASTALIGAHLVAFGLASWLGR